MEDKTPEEKIKELEEEQNGEATEKATELKEGFVKKDVEKSPSTGGLKAGNYFLLLIYMQ